MIFHCIQINIQLPQESFGYLRIEAICYQISPALASLCNPVIDLRQLISKYYKRKPLRWCSIILYLTTRYSCNYRTLQHTEGIIFLNKKNLKKNCINCTIQIFLYREVISSKMYRKKNRLKRNITKN